MIYYIWYMDIYNIYCCYIYFIYIKQKNCVYVVYVYVYQKQIVKKKLSVYAFSAFTSFDLSSIGGLW